MTDTQIQDFTLRITQSNRTGIIVILYEVLDVYLGEAISAADDYERMKEALRNAERVNYELMDALDMQYDISEGLYEIYDFIGRALERAVIRKDMKDIPRIRKIVSSMRETFGKLEKNDDSGAMMKNTEQIYAGLTYGKGTLVETTDTTAGGRGFLV